MNVKIETKLFKQMIKAISLNGLIDTPRISFKEEYIQAGNMDISNVSFSSCHFGKETFLEYEVTKEDEIGIDAVEVMKLIKHLSGDEVTISRDKNSLIIVTEHEKLKIPTLETRKQKSPSFITVEENGDLSISTDLTFYMNEMIPILKNELDSMREDESRFVMKDGKLSVMQETADGYLFQSVIKEEVKSDDFDIMFNTDYLKYVFGSVINDEVRISLGDGLPVVLENKTASYQTIFLLMAKIKTD